MQPIIILKNNNGSRRVFMWNNYTAEVTLSLGHTYTNGFLTTAKM